jgi:hypothetical protein
MSRQRTSTYGGVALALALVIGACGSEPSDFCAQVEEDNAACITPAGMDQCAQMESQCPGEVLVLESCPLQFACP